MLKNQFSFARNVSKCFQQEIAVFVVRCRAEAMAHVGKYRTINLEAFSCGAGRSLSCLSRRSFIGDFNLVMRRGCPGKPGAGKACAARRGGASLAQSRGVRRETPGSSTYLTAPARGDNSMSAKRESLEGVDSAVPQDPCDRAKARLPASSSPAGEPHTRRSHAEEAAPARAACSVLQDVPFA